jgi:hypothetical protein
MNKCGFICALRYVISANLQAELRREELSKMRALLSYQEEKFRRKNKIKSKK